MKELSVREIIEATNAKLIQGNLDYICKSFSKDSRKIEKGDTYIGIQGENFNGNLFWEDALKSGADCAIVSGIEFSEQDLIKYFLILLLSN